MRLTHSIAALAGLISVSAHAWGPLGHRMVAETAALLLDETDRGGWGRLIARHRFEMGYYAILPDSHYRFKDGAKGAVESPTHYFDIDLSLGVTKAGEVPAGVIEKKLAEVPREFAPAQEWLAARLGGKEKVTAVGSAPWRVKQLVELTAAELKDVRVVRGGYQAGASAEGETQRIFRALYLLGILSHYTGDSTMPYHSTADWNGWKTNQGGVHFFYETDCVNALEPGLSTAVQKSARANRAAWLKRWAVSSEPVAGVMLRVFLDGFRALPETARIDREQVVLQPSDEAAKRPAKRKPEGCRHFRARLIEDLAKGAVLTAWAWGRALPQGVDFTNADSLQFADFLLNPDYITPKY